MKFYLNFDEFAVPGTRYTLDPYISRSDELIITTPETSYFLFRLRQLPVWKYVEVQVSYRPDLISYMYYRNVNLANIILLYNSMLISQLVEGVTIKLFKITDFESMIAELVTRRNEAE